MHISSVRKKELYEYLIRVAKQPKKAVLSDVALETLSIIAYKQPVTKAEIEKIRGVKSDHAINKLIEYDLVKELGRMGCTGETDRIWGQQRSSCAALVFSHWKNYR